MPIYEYQCKACGHRLEALQKISEEPLKECPHCHHPTLDKLVSAAGFQLKGSGWYITDYKTNPHPHLTNLPAQIANLNLAGVHRSNHARLSS